MTHAEHGPDLKNRRLEPLLLKLGGRALEGADAVAELGRGLLALGRPVLLVHGGGAEVSDWCARLGLPARFEDGLRVTDAATLEVAVAVLAGLANRRLVAALRAAGVDAVGLAAFDGGIVETVPHPDRARLGEVGAIQSVDPSLIATLLGSGRVPVVASIGSYQGALLNLNADDLAGSLAPAIGAQELLLLSDVAGVSIDGALVSRLPAADLVALLAHPQVSGGMRPKLRAARTALAGGVARVRITSWSGTFDLLFAGGRGTTITASSTAEAHLV